MNAISEINKACTITETGFNIAGSIPYVAIASGAIRCKLGIIQMVAASAISLGSIVYQAIEQLRSRPNAQTLLSLKKVERYSNQHIIHGALNAIRGFYEAACAIGTFGILNVAIFLPYNLSRTPEFSPVKEYREPSSPQIYVF